MLDSLLQMEIAYNLLKSENDLDGNMDILDKHYNKLNCKIEVNLEKYFNFIFFSY